MLPTSAYKGDSKLGVSHSDYLFHYYFKLSGCRLTRHNYWFITHNGWPVSCKQENQLTVIDILEDSCINVDIQTFITPTSSPSSPSPQPRKKIKG